MRDRLIKLLEFPRYWIPDQLEYEMCPNGRHYNERDGICRQCLTKSECRWLADYDECVEVGGKSLQELATCLDMAMGFVDSRFPYDKHNAYRCACEACSWRRSAERLLDEVYTNVGRFPREA